MSSPVAHGLAAYSLLITIEPRLTADPQTNRKTFLVSVLFGSMADADFLVAHFTKNPVLQHHFFSHSIFFGIGVFFLCFLILKLLKQQNAWNAATLLGAAYNTHLVLDYFTEDRSHPFGIPLFWPFTNKHYLAPVEIFHSIHRGTVQSIFSIWNLTAILQEVFILMPVALLAFLRARKAARASWP